MYTDPPSEPENRKSVSQVTMPTVNADSITLNGASVQWEADKGLLKVNQIDSVLFKTEPSLCQLLAPGVKEIGQDLYRLLTALSASAHSRREYEKIEATYADFIQGFDHWGELAASSGWGKFSLIEFDPASTHALIQVDNPWELQAQRSLRPEERWGCPFIFGKMLGLFKYALGNNCWASDTYSFYENGESRVNIKIHASDKTIEEELKKLRQQKLTLHEVALAQEIEQKTAELQHSYNLLENIANLDFLTNLNNRRAFEERLLSLKQSESWNEYTLLFVDLDQFKVVNDTCGHVAGDKLLTLVSDSLLKSTSGKNAFIARYDADTFLILLKNDCDDSLITANDLRTEIKKIAFHWNGKTYQTTCSIGLIPLNTIEPKVKNAIIAADNACYQAKKNGGNQIYISKSLNEFVENRLTEMNWIHKINNALTENKFCLHYQVIQPLDGSIKFGLEALIRMQDHDGSLIPPFNFLPAAERYNAIYKIDCWVINEVFQLLNREKDKLKRIDFISVNLSGDTLSNPKIKNYIHEKFEQYKINPEKICFEITETHMVMNLDRAKSLLEDLREYGCKIALDDFGAGMSSFGYLRELPIDKIKIDGNFVKHMDEDMVDYTFVESIANLAKSMNIETVAEFVENEKIMEMLTDISVDYGQGFYIRKPCPWHEIFAAG